MNQKTKRTHLETLVLKDLLDGNILRFLWLAYQLSLKNDAERAVPNDLAISVGDLSLFVCFAIRSDDTDDPMGVIDG